MMDLVLETSSALPFPGTGWVVLVASLALTVGWLLHIYR
jgi:hypothetical protein